MPTNKIDAWSVLAAEASAFGRNWGRYGAPSDAVEFRTEAEASLPSPALPAGDVPEEIRSMIIGMDEAIRAPGCCLSPAERGSGSSCRRKPAGSRSRSRSAVTAAWLDSCRHRCCRRRRCSRPGRMGRCSMSVLWRRCR